MKISREFYERNDALQISKDLLGKVLVVPAAGGKRVSGKIVETEAYLGAPDKAAHAFGNRRTKRTEILFGRGGFAYIFFIYGMYYQLNISAGGEGIPFCVLVRGVEPVEGIEIMRERRGEMKDTNLTSGPGKLCIAFGIDKTFYGEDLLLGERIRIEEGEKTKKTEILSGRRIGVDYAEEYAEKPWRFWIKDNPFVSR